MSLLTRLSADSTALERCCRRAAAALLTSSRHTAGASPAATPSVHPASGAMSEHIEPRCWGLKRLEPKWLRKGREEGGGREDRGREGREEKQRGTESEAQPRTIASKHARAIPFPFVATRSAQGIEARRPIGLEMPTRGASQDQSEPGAGGRGLRQGGIAQGGVAALRALDFDPSWPLASVAAPGRVGRKGEIGKGRVTKSAAGSWFRPRRRAHSSIHGRSWRREAPGKPAA